MMKFAPLLIVEFTDISRRLGNHMPSSSHATAPNYEVLLILAVHRLGDGSVWLEGAPLAAAADVPTPTRLDACKLARYLSADAETLLVRVEDAHGVGVTLDVVVRDSVAVGVLSGVRLVLAPLVSDAVAVPVYELDSDSLKRAIFGARFSSTFSS
jgi:hypothetical protein